MMGRIRPLVLMLIACVLYYSQLNSVSGGHPMSGKADIRMQNGWDDIAYNFLIGGDEKVYIGRGWDTVGAHAGSTYYNSHSIGTSIIGNYSAILPSPGVLQVLKDLNECGAKSGYMTSRYVLRGHRDVRQLGPTDCPGETLYKEIRKWPHYLESDKTSHPDV